MTIKYLATKSGFKEIEMEKEKDNDKTAITEGVTTEKKKAIQPKEKKPNNNNKKVKAGAVTKKKAAPEENMDIPYPELGHTVSQLSQMEDHKRKSILGAKDADFVKKYL